MSYNWAMEQPVSAVVRGVHVERYSYRWFGILELQLENGERTALRLPLTGNIAQWFQPGERVRIALLHDKDENNTVELDFADYELWRIFSGPKGAEEQLLIWPPFQREYVRERSSPLSGEPLYRYRVLAREARYESDFAAIVELEQYHYASDKELLAKWYCPADGTVAEANLEPRCPRCGRPMRFWDLKSATRASRFLILQLRDREPYEPEFIGYVRIDPPIPLMHRRLPDGRVEPHIRQKVFPEDWFRPTYWPERLYEELREQLSPCACSQAELWVQAEEQALRECDTRTARLARVVIHPDYRADGLGQLAVQAALEWVAERRVPEMRRAKALIETIAMMARYNPFMERAGFRYAWETASGRPVLFYPLSAAARDYLEKFLRTDPTARRHGGRLYRSRYRQVEQLAGPIRGKNITKFFQNELSLEGLPEELQLVLSSFGVRERVIQKVVFKGASFVIQPGQVVALVGASGAGKTTFLRLLYGRAGRKRGARYRLDDGELELPKNTRPVIYLPGEEEPRFGRTTLLETLYRLTADEFLAIEVLNVAGISDAVLYRAHLNELSTGQKERAKLAYLLAQRPNLLLIDELAAHLDPGLALRVARKLASFCREKRITLVAATHRREVLQGLEPDQVLLVGYGVLRPLPPDSLGDPRRGQ